jgi:mono/diheme cytochrome c family protein
MSLQKILSLTCCLVMTGAFVASQYAASVYAMQQTDSGRLTPEEVKNLKNPAPYTKESITRGRTLFQHDCTGCHGADGKAEVDVIADATNLTEPKLWKSGTSEGEIFRSIRDGAGLNMPPYKNQILKEEDLWHLVNYIRSLWPEPLRPKLQDEPHHQ